MKEVLGLPYVSQGMRGLRQGRQDSMEVEGSPGQLDFDLSKAQTHSLEWNALTPSFHDKPGGQGRASALHAPVTCRSGSLHGAVSVNCPQDRMCLLDD